MNEMIERVARAMHNPNEVRGDGEAHDALAREPWEELSAAARSRYLSYARTAIKAMREPTEAMIKAGFMACGDGLLDDEQAKWRAMIDAALDD